MNTKPIPIITPLFVWARYASAKWMIYSATCGWADMVLYIHSVIKLSSPKPRAMAKSTAATGTMASIVLKLRAVA